MVIDETTKLWKTALRGMNESASLKEATIRAEIALAKEDPTTKEVLDAIYLDEDRAASFERFCKSGEFRAIRQQVLRRTKGNLNASICEVGAGPGFLAVALAQSGFTDICMLEPNGEWHTGTGFIRPLAEARGVRIWNDLDAWYDSDTAYDVIITKACVHHFTNVSKVAAELACKLRDGGEWLMFDEFFANTTKDFYLALRDHSHAIKYGQYEWPYAAGMYVDLLNLVGFSFIEAIPNRYDSNYISRNVSGAVKLSKTVTAFTNMLLRARMTTLFFRLERMLGDALQVDGRFRFFTKPQLLVFRRNSTVLPEMAKSNANLPNMESV